MKSTIMIEVSEPGADPVRLDQLSRHLLLDLRGAGLDAEREPTQAPAGAKAGVALTVSTLVIGLAGTNVVGALVTAVIDWLRPRRGSVKVSCGDKSIELSSASRAERDLLLDWLLKCGDQTQEERA